MEEAGGRVTDAAGNLLDFSRGRTLADNQGVVATNGPLHESVVKVLFRPISDLYLFYKSVFWFVFLVCFLFVSLQAVCDAFEAAGGPLKSSM